MFLESNVRRATRMLADWSANLDKLVNGRPAWTAEREFSYYAVDSRAVREYRRRQIESEQTACFAGLRTLRTLGMRDLRVLRGARVLDLGAGECLLSDAMTRCGATVWATDAIPKQIWAAAERHADRNDLRFAIADAQDLPFASEAFDVVTAHLVLHHIEPLDGLLREVVRALRPGGHFAAVEPTPLVGGLIHHRTSANEAPIAPGAVMDALRARGFVDVEFSYVWTRFETARLGPLSPGYRVSARKAGEPTGHVDPEPLRRALRPMRLPGLLLDEGCTFSDLALAQEEEILAELCLPARPG